MNDRRVIGLAAAGTVVVAIHGLVSIVRAALAEHSISLIVGGALPAVLMVAVAAMMAKVAYRNLFWSRYVQSVRAAAAIAPTGAAENLKRPASESVNIPEDPH
jgi:hypothetical protein